MAVKDVTLAVADDGGCGESGRKEGGDGLDVVVDVAEEREVSWRVAMVAALHAGVEVEVEVLEAE